MKLNLPFFEKKEQSEYFLALVLRDEKAIAVILEKSALRLKILSQDEEYFDDTIESASTENLLNIIDKAITKAETVLPPNLETHKTIFGLKGSWVEENKIKPNYLEKLKKISGDLDLSPIGFLVVDEAVANLLQREEGAPTTAILTDIGKKYTTISLIKTGRIVETKSMPIEGSIATTVDTLLKHLQKVEVLPSKIIIFGDNENLSQEFISHQWSKSLPFMHVPQIVNVDTKYDSKAMLYGAGQQMGLQVIDSTKPVDFTESFEELHTFDYKEGAKEEPTTETEVAAEKTEEKTSEPEEEIVGGPTTTPGHFGFIEGHDVTTTQVGKKEVEKKTAVDEENFVASPIEEIPNEINYQETEQQEIPSKTMAVLPQAKTTLTKVFANLKKIPFQKILNTFLRQPGNKKFIILIPVVLIALIFLTFVYYVFASSAEVTLNVKPKTEEQTKTVTFSAGEPTDIAGNIISSEFQTVSKEGTTSMTTTGKKAVGDKAKGKVTIFNNSDNSKDLAQGTKLVSSNSLEFTTDKAVTVASASGDVFSGTKPGTTTVEVTASDIGQEYNLPSNTKFSIGTNSFVAAKNDSAFSGGTKKEIQVVSKDDIAKLLADLPKKLQDSAQKDLQQKISSDKELLPSFVDSTVDKQSFDKKEGDQANQLNLKGTVSFKGLTYKKDDILNYSQKLFESSNLTLNKNDINIKVKDVKTNKNKDVEASLVIQALLLPKVDSSDLAKQIKGMSWDQAIDKLSQIQQVSSVDISVSPNIPFFPRWLPRNSNNIKFAVNGNG